MANVRRAAKTIDVGVADMLYYPADTETPIYLGLTQGGVKVSYETEYHEIISDQTENRPLDDVLLGEKVTVTGVSEGVSVIMATLSGYTSSTTVTVE